MNQGYSLQRDSLVLKQAGPAPLLVRLAAQIKFMAPFAWYRFGQGITMAPAVSQWADQSGNGRHFAQASASAQPSLQADRSILLDGVAQYLITSAFTLPQPATAYLLFKQVTFTAGDRIFDLNIGGTTATCTQNPSTPGIRFNAGVALDSAGLALDTYGVMAVVLNGANSAIQINNVLVSGDAGANNPTGFVLGATQTPGNFGNIQVKEALLFGAAHSASQRAAVVNYLSRVGRL